MMRKLVMLIRSLIVVSRMKATYKLVIHFLVLVMTLTSTVNAQNEPQAGNAISAVSANPRTEWFRESGYGIFVHYLNGIQNNPDKVHSLGKQSSWDECVAEFDTEKFADQMEQAGAGYVIFTVMQVSPGATAGLSSSVVAEAVFSRYNRRKRYS